MQVLDTSVAMSFGNWIPDINRNNLPKPPAWFLKRLWDQDPGLVIVPARTARKYLLARRRDRSLAVPMIVENLKTAAIKKHARVMYSDGDLLASLKLVAVDTIVGNFHTGWAGADAIIADLRDRDMWADGGVDAYIARVEAKEEQTRLDQRKKFLDDVDHRASDAYRSYKARTGQRNHTAKNIPVRQSSPSSRTDGVIITG
jgi:hypothetical protein